MKMKLGSWLHIANISLAEVFSEYFDCIVIDLEHGMIGLDSCYSLIPVIQKNSKCFVRTWGNDYNSIARILDAGPDGIIVPRVNNIGIAENVIQAARYPKTKFPAKEEYRGYGIGRAQGFDPNVDFNSIRPDLILQLEHVDVMSHLDWIFSRDIDGIFVGPYDFTASMGIPAQFENPEYQKHIETILQKAQQYNLKYIGIHVVDADTDKVKYFEKMGYNFIAVGTDMVIFNQALKNICEKLK